MSATFHRKWLLCTLILLTLPVWGLARETKALSVPGQFADRVEPVVLQGAQLEGLLGADLENVSVLAVDASGQLKQIPFQIDERFPGGEYIFIANKLPDTGKLSKEDEVVFMARDAGEKMKPEIMLTSSRAIKEIELFDSVSGTRAWVYIATLDIPQVKSPIHYLDYDPVERSAMGTSYFMTFPTADMALAKETPWKKLSLSVLDREAKDATTHASVFTPNVLQSEFLSVHCSAFGELSHWDLSLKNLNVKEVGERVGPIRTIRKFRMRPYLGYGFSMKPITVVQTLYDQFTTTQVKGDLSGAAVSLMTSIQVSFGEEMTPVHTTKPVAGWQVSADKPWQAVFEKSVASPACPDCLKWQFDAKKLPAEAFQFEFLRYFPKNNTPEEVKSFEHFYAKPLRVRTATLNENVSLKNFR